MARRNRSTQSTTKSHNRKQARPLHALLLSQFFNSPIPELRTAALQLVRRALEIYGARDPAAKALGIAPRTFIRWCDLDPTITKDLNTSMHGAKMRTYRVDKHHR